MNNSLLFDRCVELPSNQTCYSLVPYTHYTPDLLRFTEEISNEFDQLVQQYPPFDACRAFITAVSCVYEFPPCDPTTGVLLPICSELCTDIEDNIEDCTIDSFEDYPAIDELFNVFECTEPETYFMNLPPQYILNDETGCTELRKYCTYARM